jgi:hypothetical protein
MSEDYAGLVKRLRERSLGDDFNVQDEALLVEAASALAALCDDNDDLRALLREHGRHAEGCDAVLNDGIAAFAEMRGIPRSECATYRCRCGWDVAEKGLEGK